MSLMRKLNVDFDDEIFANAREAQSLARIGLSTGDAELCLKAVGLMADADPCSAINFLSEEFDEMRAIGRIGLRQTHLLL